jgi:hypothetical protein
MALHFLLLKRPLAASLGVKALAQEDKIIMIKQSEITRVLIMD